jgi:hypothetical protein
MNKIIEEQIKQIRNRIELEKQNIIQHEKER